MTIYFLLELPNNAIVVDILNKNEVTFRQKINTQNSKVSFCRGVRMCKNKIWLISWLWDMLTVTPNIYEFLQLLEHWRSWCLVRWRVKYGRSCRVSKKNYCPQWEEEVLLKAVIETIPTYLMRVHKAPPNVILNIHLGMAKFWWGKKGRRGKFTGRFGKLFVT